MADEILRSRHAFGSLSNVQNAIEAGKIDAYDILFLDGDSEPKIGWLDKNGELKLVTDEKADLSEVEADIDNLESGLSDLGIALEKKADAEEVEAKIAEKADAVEVEAELATKANTVDVEKKLEEVASESVATAKAYTDGKIEAAVNEHLVKKYEITSLPEGSLVNYREGEIRIMCRENAEFTKQSVGTGGDPNCYYLTLKTYVFDDNVIGYREYLGTQADSETLTDLKTDKYGRKYQPTWLALAKYDEATGVWNYYGKNSSAEKFVGWDYRIDWYDANGVVIASDSIRINLANEDCYFASEPYYVGSIMKEVDTKIEEKIAEVEAAYEIVEF